MSYGRRRLRDFIEYVDLHRTCPIAGLRRAALFRAKLDTRFGQLAIAQGLLGPADTLAILQAQAESEASFGDLCVRHGLMNSAQRDAIAALQNDEYRLFCQCLLWSGVMTTEELARIRAEFESRVPVEPEADIPRTPARVRAILRRVREVASLPELVRKVLAVLEPPEPDLVKASRIIEADPVMSSQMIRVVNSALYGLRGKVASVLRASVMIGARGTRQVVLSTGVAGMFRGWDGARDLWLHSIRATRWAVALAQTEGLPDLDEAVVAGIVHEFGAVVLHQHFPPEMAEIESLRREGLPLREADVRVLGMTREEAGAYLARQWTFPTRIVESILYQREPVARLRNLTTSPIARIVHAACRLADFDLARNPEEWELDDAFVDFHRLTTDRLIVLAPIVRKQAEDLGALLR